MHKLEFIPLYFSNRLHVINPFGSIGLVTLWSNPDYVLERLSSSSIDLSPTSSKIAVVGTLFGEGFRHLLRNLLYNPQIDTLLLFGQDLSESSKLLENFFSPSAGIEYVDSSVVYKSTASTDIRVCRVVDTHQLMDDLITPSLFNNRIRVVNIRKLSPSSDGLCVATLSDFLSSYAPSILSNLKRIEVPLPEVGITNFPSNVRNHSVVADRPVEAWRLLIHRLFRFGNRIKLPKGERIELHNVKVLINEPVFDEASISSNGFSVSDFKRYQKSILRIAKPDDQPYSYGNRMRGYFNVDQLLEVSEKLLVNLESGVDINLDERKCYVSLWDPSRDLEESGKPCMVSLFFRKLSGVIHLTAVYRTHNAIKAWLENVHGLLAVLDFVCHESGGHRGSITVISHSISLDPSYLERAKIVYDEVSNKNVFREDPHGHVMIRTEGKDIIVEHWFEGVKLHEYCGSKPGVIQYALYRDLVVSDINHAFYIGMQLEKAYWCITHGIDYVQSDLPGSDGL